MTFQKLPLRALLLAGLVGGCASNNGYDSYPVRPNDQRVPNYRLIIKQALTRKEVRTDPLAPPVTSVTATQSVARVIPDVYAPYQVSGARLVDTLDDWSWLVCLKGQFENRPTYNAVFIRDSRIVETRQSIAIDGCAAQSFENL